MKEKSWKECLESNSSIKISIDEEKIMSLIEIADNRINYLHRTSIKDENANFIFEGYYSSLLEILHALILSRGYKISNHICLGFYLRDVLEREDHFVAFNDCRYKRNALLYYGKKMDSETAKTAIDTCKILMKEIRKII